MKDELKRKRCDDEDEDVKSMLLDGFTVLSESSQQLQQIEIEWLYSIVMEIYDYYIKQAKIQQIDLTLRENAEVMNGFYVREGGRIDIQLWSLPVQHNILLPIRIGNEKLVKPLIDHIQLSSIADRWKEFVHSCFTTSDYILEYIGCVISRPGDKDQNWHLDGVHRDTKSQLRVDRLNIFVPLQDLNDVLGGTEMKKGSHFHDNGNKGTTFEDYKDLPSFTNYVKAGTPIAMDYRVWHRGRANTSTDQKNRLLMYFKFTKQHHSNRSSMDGEKKQKKRILPLHIAKMN